MRDRRFVAVHRGGPLACEDHRRLARWAAECAEVVLPAFTRRSADEAPRRALEMARAWAAGEVRTGVAMQASLAAHAAARTQSDMMAVAAARAAGQAVATAHCADHSMGALLYALKVLVAAGEDWSHELTSRLARLPAHLRAPVSEGLQARLPPFLRRTVPAEVLVVWGREL